MQMVNLGLSIFGKIQTMQHRQIKIAQAITIDRKEHNRKLKSIKPEDIELFSDAIIIPDNKI